MRIFCPATLSVLFLPRFVARLVRLELPRLHSPCLDDDTTNTEAIGTKSKFSGVPRFGSRSGSAAAVRLSLFSGTRGRACRLLTHPAPDNLSTIWHVMRTGRVRCRTQSRYCFRPALLLV